jgi:Protein of unknown function (DUF456).
MTSVPVDPFFVGAVALLVAGVVAVVVPLVPGSALSVGGVWLYWWSTGYTGPPTAVVAALTLVGVASVAIELGAEVLGARAGGASTLSSVLAAPAGLVGLFALGPIGMLAGIAATIVAVEVYRGATLRDGLRAATVAITAALASGVVQALLALSILIVFLTAVL